MKWKGTVLLTAFLVVAINVPVSHAQQAGFSVGVGAAPTGVAPIVSAPVQPFVTAPVQPFVSSPVQPFVTAPVQPFVTSPVTPFGVPMDPFPGHFTPGFGTIPGVTFDPFFGSVQAFPGSGIVSEQVIAPAPGVIARPAVRSPQLVIPGPVFAPAGVPRPVAGPVVIPAAGTARAEVIRQLGQPQVIIVNTDGETMLFENDLTIFLRDGVVAPR